MQKYVRKMEPYRYQRKDNQERTPEVRDSKPLAGEIKMTLGGLTVGGTLKFLKKHKGEK